MLYCNDIFRWNGGQYRLLNVDEARINAWVILLDAELAWPVEVPFSEIAHLTALKGKKPEVIQPSAAMAAKRDYAHERIAPLLDKAPLIYFPKERSRLVEAQAEVAECSERTLHKDLRRYWQGGQTADALLPSYQKSGRRGDDVTAGRGRTAKAGRDTYQLTEDDIKIFKKAAKKKYLKDFRTTMTAAFQDILNKNYTYTDGNGKPFVKNYGERPTFRQFQHFVLTTYSLEQRIRGRHGDKEYERNHRGVLGTVLADCLGVGHYYEIDATICDVYLVSTEDVNKIVGKATLFLIIDRKSRLIVGFYLGLENASWISAMEAILSISMDKAELCARYGVEYDPEDWPAHCVMPKAFLADRGEVMAAASTQVSADLRVAVTNVPGLRPDWKPLAECSFKLIHAVICDEAPAYDPPSNATKRRGKHYEKDASLTLKGFGNLVLNAIIASNRRAIRNYPFTLKELTAGVEPNPIALWNHGIVERSGVLTRYSEESVRHALLPRAKAKVSEKGILFGGCFYSCSEASARGWFAQGRKTRFPVDISFDSRLVDVIYIRGALGGDMPVEARLTARSEKYRGLSFAEVKYYEDLADAAGPGIEASRAQTALEFHNSVVPVTDAAKKRLVDEGSGKSRTAKRADIKKDRQAELRDERQAIAKPKPQKAKVVAELPSPTPAQTATVLPFPTGGLKKPPAAEKDVVAPTVVTNETGTVASIATATAPKTIADIAREARMRMING